MKDCTPLSIVMLVLFEIMQLFVGKINRYCGQYLNVLDEVHSSLPDVAVNETYLFLSIIVQMEHD
jgi:hypothetical protein